MPHPSRVLLAATVLALGACQYLPFGNDETKAISEEPAPAEMLAPAVEAAPPADAAPEPVLAACDVLASRGWEAWVDRMPGPGATPTVHITGLVDVRSGGYTFEWVQLPTDRSATPAFRVALVAKAPTAPATQAITTETVKFAGPALSARYSSAIISCGSLTIGTVAQVRDTN